MPYITQVAVGKLKELGVFGNDYDTPDGTGVRDYIHVVDLSIGHLKALEKARNMSGGVEAYNLGTGNGYSVLEIIPSPESYCITGLFHCYWKRRENTGKLHNLITFFSVLVLH